MRNLGPRDRLLTRKKKPHGPDTSATLWGTKWSSEGRKVPDSANDTIQALKEPTNKTEAQHLIGLFG